MCTFSQNTLKLIKQSFNGSIAIGMVVLFLSLSINIEAQTSIAQFNFDNDTETGWTFNSGDCSWTIGQPNAGQGYNDIFGQRSYVGNIDPSDDYTADNTIGNVAGQGLGASSKKEGRAAYYNNSNEWIQSPAINCETYINVELEYYRWANFEPGYDYGFIEVSNDGSIWNTVYAPTILQDNSWVKHTINISKYADRQAEVYIRWRSESDGSVFYAGWNIDDVTISGIENTNDYSSTLTRGSVNAPAKISSLVDVNDDKISVANFTITDPGTGDDKATIIDTLRIVSGAFNELKEWNKTIANAYLYNAAEDTRIPAIIGSEELLFRNSSFLTVADGSAKTFTLELYLKAQLPANIDNQQFDFVVDYVNIIENHEGSFISSGEFSTGNSKMVLDIAATQLKFVVEPEALVTVDRDLLPIVNVAATDANGNVDMDYTGTITLNNSGELSMSGTSETTINGVAAFIDCKFTETGGPVELLASHNGSNTISNATSSVSITIDESAINNAVFFDNFDNTNISGWTSGSISGTNAWSKGVPNGGRGYSSSWGTKGYVGNADPTSDYSSDNGTNNVYGQGLSSLSKQEGACGYYNNSEDWLMTPAIDLTNYYNTQLSFARWANMEPYYDSAFVEISVDGSNWLDLGQPYFPSDNRWTKVHIDISTIADRQATVYIRWRTVTDGSIYYSGWNIDDVTVDGILSPVTNWTGTVSSEWHDGGNWSSGMVPNQMSNVYIDAGTPFKPVVTTAAICNEIIIKKNTALLVESSGSLVVYGDVNIETDASDYGAFIDRGNVTIHGNGVVSRFFKEQHWHYLSTPVNVLNTSVIGENVYSYEETLASDDWIEGWVLVENKLMQVGKGYDTYKYTNDVVEIIGDFNTGDVRIDVTYTNGSEVAEHEGWNLIGNPYPSAIDWDAPSGWTKNNVNNAIYIWDEQKQNFVTYISGVGVNGGSRFVPPMQGFFVKASNPGAGYVGMTNDIRIINTESKFKSTADVTECLRIELSNESYSDETIVRFVEGTSMNFDNNYDAFKKFSTNSMIPQVYTKTGKNELLTINSLPSERDYSQEVLFMNIPQSGVYTVSFEGVWDIDHSKTVYLEDTEEDTLIDLRVNEVYEFYSKSSFNSERFIIHVGMPLTIDSFVSNESALNKKDGAVDIEIYGGAQPLVKVEWSTGQISEDISAVAAGEYIVSITDANGDVLVDTVVVGKDYEDITSLNLAEASKVKVYSIDGRVALNIPESTGFVSEVEIFNVDGTLVFESSEQFKAQTVLPVQFDTGLYLVRFKQNNEYAVEKIVINN